MEDNLLKIFSLFLVFILVCFFIYKKAFINNELSCNNYILNTYLYIILSIILVSIIVLSIDRGDINNLKYFQQYYWILFIFTIGFLLLTMIISPRQIILKHLSWLSFICLIGLTMYPIYLFTKMNNVFLRTLITTLVIVLGLTAVAFYKPEMISLSWGPILITLLVIGIVMRVLNIFLNNNPNTQGKMSYILSYVFIIIFSFLLLYDTKKLQVNAKKCIIPDYVNESIGIFLDIINLFSNLGRVNSR